MKTETTSDVAIGIALTPASMRRAPTTRPALLVGTTSP